MGILFFFQAEDGIRDLTVTGVQTVLFRSDGRYHDAEGEKASVNSDRREEEAFFIDDLQDQQIAEQNGQSEPDHTEFRTDNRFTLTLIPLCEAAPQVLRSGCARCRRARTARPESPTPSEARWLCRAGTAAIAPQHREIRA